jgi:hypothetical protein
VIASATSTPNTSGGLGLGGRDRGVCWKLGLSLNDENNDVRSRDQCSRKPCPLGRSLYAY